MVTTVALSVASWKSAMATAISIDQILRDLLGPEGCNEWFSDDLPAGDEDALNAAVSLSSKDSLETENICKTAPFSLEGFQSYLDEAATKDGVLKVKSLPMSVSLTGSGGKFAEPKTDEVSPARESAIPEKTRQGTAYCVWMWDQWASFKNEWPGT